MPKISSIRSILENTLFVWIGLTLIIVLAGSSLVLPNWLQVIGRGHPILLHFPIVLLLMGLLFFWIPGIDRKPEIKEIGEISFLAGCNFAGITVIAGLILAQEEYTGDTLTWHKWGGLLVFGGCVLLYFFRSIKVNFIRLSTLALAIAIVLTGHWGAGLTHGEDFLLAPVRSADAEEIPLAEAEIFRDVVQPILQAKCISCHKKGKIKGELRMDHIEGLKKGGKTGPFAVAGDFENSLLIQRINLPEDDKKHMPPQNKVQLTDKELLILSEWVASGADFDTKLITLPTTNKLYQLASLKFEENKTYSFKAADADDIANLNTSFRSVQALYPESPALAVSYFGTSAFQPKSLSELKIIKDQIVRLNLNKMPLDGVELKFLTDFKHLEELQLNFTDLNAEQLKVVSELKTLEILAISGNTIDNVSLQNLGKMKSLKKLYLWQTGLGNQDRETIQKSLPATELFFGFDGKGIIYELNSPAISLTDVIYQDSLEVKLSHPIKTAELRYTLDGTEPDSITSTVYTKPIFVKSTGKIRAQAYAEGWKGSKVTEAVFMHSGIKPSEFGLVYEPDSKYKASGAATLFDLEKAQASNHGQKWLGFQDKPMVLEVSFEENNKPREVFLSLLYNEAAHIFPPSAVTIQGLENGKWKELASDSPTVSSVPFPARSELLSFDLENISYEKLKIIVNPLTHLPKWHPDAGSKGWVFVDEVIFNK
ncbi:chitobiase/beta-hexosaminidase C-terminal domain-containing protein [Algoriphagus sp. AGSA1]|uniref:FN3 associated domain-containing protein n=1 Tax=Algoriphagus sp. AGSA1 TaxID=2907213 RepID=UPI001F28C25B|nr:c-type cytochrome domain-containing protein [Algoriphagus sp. AGSA1]MCE7055500.1 chitobiase/beta-hexosaminidase C-terminal domain-containing protein [Algoriphagus sp. AGSA1]